MRLSDLSLDIIRQMHAEDTEAYKRTSPSPQHIHRLWLLRHIEEQDNHIRMLENALGLVRCAHCESACDSTELDDNGICLTCITKGFTKEDLP